MILIVINSLLTECKVDAYNNYIDNIPPITIFFKYDLAC